MNKTDDANWKNVKPEDMTPGQTIKFLESEVAELKEIGKRVHRERENEMAFLKEECAWWEAVATQASMFLNSVTNTATLAGRGWQETKRRLDEVRPKHAKPPHYTLAP